MRKSFETQSALFVSSTALVTPWPGRYRSGIGLDAACSLDESNGCLENGPSQLSIADAVARFIAGGLGCRMHNWLPADIVDATTLGRFRQQLVTWGLWEKLLGEVSWQLEDQHIIMREGRVNIIDATPVEVAQLVPGVDGKPTKDGESGWHVKQKTS